MDRAVAAASVLLNPAARAAAWADIDRRVTRLAPAVAVDWAQAGLVRSRDVVGVTNASSGGWDLT